MQPLVSTENSLTSTEIKLLENYKSWKKVSKSEFVMDRVTAMSCSFPTFSNGLEIPSDKGSDQENSPHKDKYINVFVNAVGQNEFLNTKNPKFPIGTVIVKEKLKTPESILPELLTVMVKRKKGFNPKVGDWEFMTLDGKATKITSKGKLESCQACHLEYKKNDFVTRIYLTDEIKQKLK
jgi:hypothetical protein